VAQDGYALAGVPLSYLLVAGEAQSGVRPRDGRSNAVRALLISTIGVATLGLMLAESRTYPLGLRVAGLALGHLDASVTILG